MQFYENCVDQENWWRLAPESVAQRLAVQNYRRAVPVPQKYKKQRFS